jgi:hypothetical protein
MRRLTVLACLVLLPVVALAQVRGGAPAGARTMISAPRVMPRTSPVSGRALSTAPSAYRAAPVRPSGTVISGRRPGSSSAGRIGNHPSANDQFGFLPDFTGAPGLGFDYAHYAATHRGAGRRRGGAEVAYFPFFDSGFILPYAQNYAPAEQDDSPRYDSPGPETVAADAPSADRRYPGYGLEAVSTYDVRVTPQKPSESYVFVRRDGTLFFAVAYSWADGTLYYVTQEGLRRSLGRDALDLDATQQFNEQRGLSFRSPV